MRLRAIDSDSLFECDYKTPNLTGVDMNEHLAPIFSVVLPELHRSGSKYWVYGGVAIAGIKGNFLRPNPDVALQFISQMRCCQLPPCLFQERIYCRTLPP